ncbi:hypothetical protein CRG98_014838 [Punica granatum]|uniref:Uncharacterized protein n=1 Tax=Punica granatum TaxID=22663 RepID=A0A2I0K8A7_PUNGR|nr:hypothetical protein CRG98_014838 [Punica granatum]
MESPGCWVMELRVRLWQDAWILGRRPPLDLSVHSILVYLRHRPVADFVTAATEPFIASSKAAQSYWVVATEASGQILNKPAREWRWIRWLHPPTDWVKLIPDGASQGNLELEAKKPKRAAELGGGQQRPTTFRRHSSVGGAAAATTSRSKNDQQQQSPEGAEERAPAVENLGWRRRRRSQWQLILLGEEGYRAAALIRKKKEANRGWRC